MRVGYELVALMLLNAVVQSLLLHVYFHRAFRTGMRLKAAVRAASESVTEARGQLLE